VARIIAKPGVAVAMGKALFYRQVEVGIDSATPTPRHHGHEHDGSVRARGCAGLHREAPTGMGLGAGVEG
jgi:hypothetical protein